MARLIDADEVIEKVKLLIQVDKEEGCIGTRLFTLQNVIDFLNEAETIDPVKHGHWIRHLAIGWSEGHYTCSCCGYYLHFDRRENANYCPKCGARLDEDEQYYKY